MKLIKCKILGYCHGVQKTITNANRCLARAKKNNVPSYSIGNLIHNENVQNYYASKGLVVIKSPHGHPAGVALIRAHGIPDKLRQEFEDNCFELIDSTCENIKKSYMEISKANINARNVVVVGIKDHAETVSLVGSSKKECFLVSSEEDVNELASKINKSSPVSVVVQTTFPQDEYDKICKKLSDNFDDIQFCTKLCQACIARKKLSIELVQKCDAVIVLGSRNSANTVNLAQSLQKCGKPVYFFSSEKELNREITAEISAFEVVGICSGTSTPMNVIDNFCTRLVSMS